MKPAPLALLIVGAVALAGGLWTALQRGVVPHTVPGALAAVADPVPAEVLERPFALATGGARRLADWDRMVRVVNFWGTWCPPCVAEMPELQRIHDEFAAQGVTVIGVGIDNPQAILAFSAEHGIRFPLLVGGAEGSELGRALGNQRSMLPYTVVISAENRIIMQHLGTIDGRRLRSTLRSATSAR